MFKTKITIYVFLVSLFISGIFLPTVQAAGTGVNFSQVIRPLPCGVDHIIDADGIEHFFAPIECGKIVPPNQDLPPTFQTGPIAREGGVEPIYLDSKKASSPGGAYLLVVRKGMVYTFALQSDSTLALQRTMSIDSLSVSAGKVQLRFTPGDKVIDILQGERIRLDLTFDGNADIDLSYLPSNSLGDSATLRVWFPALESLSGDQVHTTRDSLIAGMILGIVASGALYLHQHGHKRHYSWYSEDPQQWHPVY